MWVPSLGWEDPLEEGMATHSSILAWRIPWTREALRGTVHEVTKSQTWLEQLSMHAYIYICVYTYTHTHTYVYVCLLLCMKVKVLVTQSCLTLCDPMNGRLPGSSVHGIPRWENWSGLPFPSPGDLPDPGMGPGSPSWKADSLQSEPPGKPMCVCVCACVCVYNVCVYVYVWSERKWKWKSLSRVQLFATPCTMQSMEFSRPEYWSG